MKQSSNKKAYYIVYAGNGKTTEGMVSHNALTDREEAYRVYNSWSDFKWAYINRTIPGTPDEIIEKRGV